MHEIKNLQVDVKSGTNDIVVAGTHINHKYYDDFVFIYYLDYDITCDVKWIKKSYFFDGIYDVAFVGDNQIVALAFNGRIYEEEEDYD